LLRAKFSLERIEIIARNAIAFRDYLPAYSAPRKGKYGLSEEK
jgi:hypothetical protein